MSYAKIRPRSGTAYEWRTYNPILAEREFAIESPDSGTGTGKIRVKIGDGINHWNDLPYAFDANSASAVDGGNVTTYGTIQLRGGSKIAWESANPVLSEREIAFDITTNSFKVGNGVSRWNELKYIKSSEFISDIMDFGDEDALSVEEAEEEIVASRYPTNILPEDWDRDLNPVNEEPVTEDNTEEETPSAGINDILMDNLMDENPVEDTVIVEDVVPEEVTEPEETSEEVVEETSTTDEEEPEEITEDSVEEPTDTTEGTPEG